MWRKHESGTKKPRISAQRMQHGWVRHYDQSEIPLTSPFGHRRFDFVGMPQRGRHYFDRKPRGRSYGRSDPTGRVRVWIGQNGDAADIGCDLLEQFEQFRSQAWLKDVRAGQVGSWISKTQHQAIQDRITARGQSKL